MGNEISTGQPMIATPARRTFRMGFSSIPTPGWLRSLLHNRKATIGIIILVFFVLIALFANQLAPTKNAARIVAKGNQSPNPQYLLGTSKQGQDIFAQVVHGAQISLTVGFLTGT